MAIELQGLIDLNVELELTGFETPEINLILDEAREANGLATGPEDTVPPYVPGNAISRPGDQWLLGPHRLICGDARDSAVYEVLLDGEKAEFVFTDPPTTCRLMGMCAASAESVMPISPWAAGK